jgi:septum formation inhibitor MinC
MTGHVKQSVEIAMRGRAEAGASGQWLVRIVIKHAKTSVVALMDSAVALS